MVETGLYKMFICDIHHYSSWKIQHYYVTCSFILFYFSTFVCPTEIIAFSNRIEEFRKINTEVVACSVESVFTHLAW